MPHKRSTWSSFLSEHHKIKVMRDRSTFAKSERLLYVELSTSPVCSVTLVLDKCDAYVVGYKAQMVCYLLELDDEKSWVKDFIEGSLVSLHLGFSYTNLETKAGECSRLDISIGIKELESAIEVLYDTSSENTDTKSVAKALIICITMITEAAKFYYIEKKVCDNIVEGGRKTFYKKFYIDEFMVKLQNSWAQNSGVAQKMLPHMALMKYEKEDGDLGVGTSSSQREMSQNSENTNGNENGDGKEKVNRTSAKGKEKVTEFVEEDGDHQQVECKTKWKRKWKTEGKGKER
ncbi:ricin-like [Mercurialis annua]|uniref:ricin-like n=1 Tax=Mercurialis annua TaxID=3986 RepID=UPI0021610468|nr:ricin-like [Mercurialis annua]